MSHKPSFAVILMCLLWASPSLAVTRDAPRPGIVDIVSEAESILVFRIDSIPTRTCDWDFTDSLRFTRCHTILEQGFGPNQEWRQDLGDLLGSRTLVWNHAGCGYVPQAFVRFVEPDQATDLVVFTSRCDSTRVGLILIRPGASMEYRELADGGEDLLDLLADALPDVPPEPNPLSTGPSQTEFVDYDEGPTPIRRVEPTYPEFAREAQISGLVILNVLVGKDGLVKNIKVIHGVTGLNEAAVAAAKQWVFSPARLRGEPVSVWVDLPLEFHGSPSSLSSPLPPFPWGGGQRGIGR